MLQILPKYSPYFNLLNAHSKSMDEIIITLLLVAEGKQAEKATESP